MVRFFSSVASPSRHVFLKGCLSVSPFICHLSPSIIHPSATCPQGPFDDDSPLKYIIPLLISLLLAPSTPSPFSRSLYSLPSRSLIFPQNPAGLASASEPSPPQTWRPRSPAPQKGSELKDRKRRERDKVSYARHKCILPSLLLHAEGCRVSTKHTHKRTYS